MHTLLNMFAFGDASPSPKLSRRWKWIEAGIIVLFWVLVALLTVGREALSPHAGPNGNLREGEALYIFLEFTPWMFITPFLFWVTMRILPDQVGWLRALPLVILLGIPVAAVVDFFDHIFWNTFVTSDWKRTLSLIAIMSNFHFLSEFFIYFAVVIGGFARAYFLRSQAHQQEAIKLRLDAVQLQSHLAEARLNALRMQINPHFLFNTLHVISDHFEENPRAARRMIARLSEILRYSFDSTETREVPLSQELRFLDGYLDIQRFRFEDRLEVNIDVPQQLREAMVPTLILQPLVENAIKHGISQIEGQGIITLNVWKEGDELHLSVADNGPGSSSGNGHKHPSSGIGIRNTIERLETLYGAEQHFSIETPPSGGFITYITLPYHTSSDYFLTSVEA